MTAYIVSAFRDVRYVKQFPVNMDSAVEAARTIANLNLAAMVDEPGWVFVDSAVSTGVESVRRADGQPLDEVTLQ